MPSAFLANWNAVMVLLSVVCSEEIKEFAQEITLVNTVTVVVPLVILTSHFLSMKTCWGEKKKRKHVGKTDTFNMEMPFQLNYICEKCLPKQIL